MGKLALLIIDLQNAWHEGESAVQMDAAVPYIQAVLPLFRKKGLPIVWIQHREDTEGVVPGTRGFEWIAPLAPAPGDFEVVKTYNNSFTKTNLETILKNAGVDTVVLSGYCAEYCVVSTLVGARDRDLTPVLYRGGIASGNADNRLAIERAYDVASYGTLEAWLK